MPGRINRLFNRISQGHQKRRSTFAAFFNKYFKCCFTVERSDVDGDLKPTHPPLVWINVPSHIRVILLKIMYGIAVDLPRASITYCDSHPQFDILIRQYARALVHLDGSNFDSSIPVVENMEPNHLAALNLIRKCFSMDVINCVPALKQPIVVEGRFANCKPELLDDVLSRSIQKALVDSKNQVIDTKISFASTSKWHQPQLESFGLSAAKFMHMVSGGFSSMTKTYEIQSTEGVMGVKTLKTVKYNIGSIHLKTRFLPSIALTSIPTAKHSEIKDFSQHLLTIPYLQSANQNQFRDICHRPNSTVSPSNGTNRPFTLNICRDFNNTFKVSFKCLKYALDIIFDVEQARSFFAVIARILINVGGNFHNEFENRCVLGVERNATSDAMWLFIPYMKAMCGLFYCIFRNQQLLFTTAILAPSVDTEYQTVLTTNTSDIQSCQTSRISESSFTTSVVKDISATSVIAAHSPENTNLPGEHRPALTDEVECNSLSLGRPALLKQFLNPKPCNTTPPSAEKGATFTPLPDHLQKLDDILQKTDTTSKTNLPAEHRPELTFIDTDEVEGNNLSLRGQEWLKQFFPPKPCLTTPPPAEKGDMLAATQPEMIPNQSEKLSLPYYLQKLDEILPKNLKAISTRDLYPVVVSGEQVQLGKGAYGEVWLERLESNGPLVAVKSCDITGQGDKEKKIQDTFLVSLEARVLSFLSQKSRAFPYLYGICERVRFGTRKSIIIEYVGHPTQFKSVTLYNAVFFKDPRLTISNALRVALDIAEGVQVMHQNGFIHSDLACRNILLHHDGQRWTAKITDFGSICHISAPFDFFQLHEVPAEQRQQCIAAHREYAPELFFSNAPPTFACDIHSTGNMFLEMGSHLQMKYLYKLGKLCTRTDPKRRPVIDVIVKKLAKKINTEYL